MEAKYHESAKSFVRAIRKLSEDEEALDSVENYLAYHFEKWIKEYADTPEKLVHEMKLFANM